MAPESGQAIFGFFEPGKSSAHIDQSPVRFPQTVGKDELEWYKHSPIDASHQIRLIQLLPPRKASAGRNSVEQIRCRIYSHAFLQAPEYETLSYTWGSMSRNMPISVVLDGQEDQALFVTPQLMMALKRLRLPSTPRLLWIDQICIDQDNKEEKGPQIQLMGDIYKTAQRVAVWLGEDSVHFINEPKFGEETDTELLAYMIFKLNEASSQSAFDDLKLIEHLVDVRPTYHVASIEQRRLKAIYVILDRPWFQRAWIFQEASLAHEILIQYGPLEVRFEEFKRLIDAVSLLESTAGVQRHRSIARDTGGFEMIQIIQKSRQRLLEPEAGGLVSLGSSSFLSILLQVLRRVEAFDPRDLIFAFLAFQVDEGITSTAEAYRQTQGEVWRHAAECIVKASKSLDIFAALSGDIERELQLPSWVPYWSDCFPYSRPVSTPVSRFRASRGFPHVWKELDNPAKLHVRGKIIDCINTFPAGPFANTQGFLHSMHLFLSWGVLLDNTGRHLRSKKEILGDHLVVKLETLERDLMRIVLADGAMGSEQPFHCVYEMIDSIANATEARELRDGGKKADLTDKQRETLRDYEKLEDLALVAEMKRVFVTDNLELGMAPVAAKLGDQIAIIHGSKVPCILREVDRGSGEYRVISQCYLEGWMYGNPPKDRPHPHGMWWDEEEDQFVLV